MDRRFFLSTAFTALALPQEASGGFETLTLPQAKPVKPSEVDFISAMPKSAGTEVAVRPRHADGVVVAFRQMHLPDRYPQILLSNPILGSSILPEIARSQATIKEGFSAMRASLGTRFQSVALEGWAHDSTPKMARDEQRECEVAFAAILEDKKFRERYAVSVKATGNLLAEKLKNASGQPEDVVRSLRLVEKWANSMTNILQLWKSDKPRALEDLATLNKSMSKSLDPVAYLPDLGIRIIAGESADLNAQHLALVNVPKDQLPAADKAANEAQQRIVMELREDFALKSAARAITKEGKANVVGIIFGRDHDFVNNVTKRNTDDKNPKLTLVTAGIKP